MQTHFFIFFILYGASVGLRYPCNFRHFLIGRVKIMLQIFVIFSSVGLRSCCKFRHFLNFEPFSPGLSNFYAWTAAVCSCSSWKMRAAVCLQCFTPMIGPRNKNPSWLLIGHHDLHVWLLLFDEKISFIHTHICLA